MYYNVQYTNYNNDMHYSYINNCIRTVKCIVQLHIKLYYNTMTCVTKVHIIQLYYNTKSCIHLYCNTMRCISKVRIQLYTKTMTCIKILQMEVTHAMKTFPSMLRPHETSVTAILE